MTQFLTKQYVREDGIIDTPVQRIIGIKQAQYNYKHKKMEYKSVLQVVKQYETILQEIGDDIPAGMPNLANVFVHALSDQLQRKLLRKLWIRHTTDWRSR